MTPEPEETSPLCHRIITNTDDGETAKPDAAALSPRLQALPACGSGWSRALHTKLPTSGAPSLWLRMEQGLEPQEQTRSRGAVGPELGKALPQSDVCWVELCAPLPHVPLKKL